MSDQTQAEGAAPADEPVVAEVTAETTEGQQAQSGDDAPAELTPPAPKPKQTAQERIDELTRARRDAERDAEYWKSKALQGPQPEAQPEPKGDGKPDPAQFDGGVYDPAYLEALTDWKADQAVTRRLSERTAADQAKARDETWEQRQAKATQAHPDYDDVVVEGGKRGAWTCTPAMADAIRDSEAGAEVAYHLASNPDEARRIAGMTPIAQVREIGRLETRFEQKQAAPAKTATTAPTPAPQVRGAGGQFKVAPDTDDFAAFEKAYP